MSARAAADERILWRAEAGSCWLVGVSVLGEVEHHLLFGADEVGVVVVSGFDEDPVDGAGEGGAVR
jgi:hypothetical protein